MWRLTRLYGRMDSSRLPGGVIVDESINSGPLFSYTSDIALNEPVRREPWRRQYLFCTFICSSVQSWQSAIQLKRFFSLQFSKEHNLYGSFISYVMFWRFFNVCTCPAWWRIIANMSIFRFFACYLEIFDFRGTAFNFHECFRNIHCMCYVPNTSSLSVTVREGRVLFEPWTEL